ncbi:Origin recognition complex subunit 1, partial [Pseudolycoriella hygida]
MPRKSYDDGSFVNWIGDKIENDSGVDSYRQCVVNEFVVSIGDFVYICNPDHPLSVQQYDIVRITHLYEILDPLAVDFKYQAVVDIYRRPSLLPDEIGNLVSDLDFSREVVLDPIVDPYSLPLNAIRGKCTVMFSEPDQSIADTMANLTQIRSKRHVYICRYKIVSQNGKLSLVAVKQYEGTTPPSKLVVSPIKIVNKNSVQKVSRSIPYDNENIFSESESELDESSAQISMSKDKSSFTARRNLNSSLNEVADNYLTGSIVAMPSQQKDDLKITIKVSRKESSKNATDQSNTSSTPLKAIQYNNNNSELNNLPKRQSVSKRKNRPGSPSSPSKTPKTIQNQHGTPNRENIMVGTPKSILKSLSVRLKRTTLTSPRRRISFALKQDVKETVSSPSPPKNFSTSSSPDTPPLRRSKRRSSICHIDLVASPLDGNFVSFEDTSSILQTPKKTPRNTPNKSATKTIKTPKQTPSRTVKATPKKVVGRNLDLSFDEYDEYVPIETSLDDTMGTPPKKSRKKPNRTPSKTPKRSPSKRISSSSYKYYEESSEDSFVGVDEATPKKSRKTPNKTPKKTPKRTPSTRLSTLTPVILERKTSVRKDRSDVQLAQESLHVSAVPKTLPCRENEFRDAYKFIESKIVDETGGCMYISGVPGTGKTATITEVIKTLQLQAKRKKIPEFDFVAINGMRLTEPRQAYVQIYQQLTNAKATSEQAYSLLDRRFTTPNLNRKTTVLLVDELDILCNRRQDVIYNLLDWPSKKNAKLVVVTIANTMDLPERLLMGRVTSRLGLTRLTFQPYTHKQLQEVVQARLAGTNVFESDAVQLVARKVASISGDCRRALDICRRASEIAEADCAGKNVMVSMLHVQKAFNEMITNVKVLAIQQCSKHEQFFLQAVEAEVARTGVDETVFQQVYRQLESICALNGVTVPDQGIASRICSKLGTSRLLICEHSKASIHQKIMLNVSSDDIYYALRVSTDK